MAYTTVLVGTDGSDSSLRAVDRAAQLASGSGAALLVVTAYHPMNLRDQQYVAAQMGDASARVSGTAPAEEALATALSRARSAGVEPEGQIVEGDAVESLLNVVAQRSVDLVVVGNRGINTLSGRLLGSVPSDITHRAPCDVLVVHTTGGGRA